MPMNPDLLRSQVGILGVICSLALFVSHIPTYGHNIVNKQARDEFPMVKYYRPSWICIWHLTSILRSALWILYGSPFITQGNYLFAMSNGIGFVIELIYIIIYLVYANKKQRVYVCIVLVCEILAFAGLVLGLRFGGLPQATLISIIGNVCFSLDEILMAGFLSFYVWDLLDEAKCLEEYESYWPLLADFHNSMIWWIFALLSNNPLPSDDPLQTYDTVMMFAYFFRCFWYGSVMLLWYIEYCGRSTTIRITGDCENSSASCNDVQVDAKEKPTTTGSMLQPDINNV